MERLAFILLLTLTAVLRGQAAAIGAHGSVDDQQVAAGKREAGALEGQGEEGVDDSRMVHSSCGHLEAPTFGKMNLTISVDASGQKESVLFTCDRGHYMVGPSHVECSNGSWVGKEPTCEPVDCGAPESIENGKVVYTATTYQAKILYTCNSCYKLSGVSRRSCKKSGVWSKTLPSCIPEECELPEFPEGLYVRRNAQNPGKPVCGLSFEVGCFLGYRQSGARRGTCVSHGVVTWEGANPRCTKY